MIPLKTTIHSHAFPFVNYTLILVNLMCFLYEIRLGPAVEPFIATWGVIPARLLHPQGNIIQDFAPLATSMFLHGGWVHFLGNMLYLYIFGGNVEDRLGHTNYFIFYILCGMCAATTQLLITPRLHTPMIGASGAIAGIMGSYICLYPRARIVTLLFFFFFVQLVEIPAFFFLAFWFIMQFFNGTLSLSAQTAASGGVAWWAHIGGFAAGILLHLLLKKKKSIRTKRRR